MKTKLAFTLMLIGFFLNSEAQWQQLHPRPTGWAATSISIPGENRVYAVAAAHMLMSNNMGATWEITSPTRDESYLNQVAFANLLQGVACSDDGKVFVTTDGGQTWTKNQLTPSADLYSVKMLPSGVGFVGGDYGKLFKTTDFGETWAQVEETFDQDNIKEIFLLDNENVFLFDDWDAFYWSNDGGQSWSESQLININTPYSIQFFDASNGLVGDDKGTLLKTNNGGQSWQSIHDDNETAFYCMSFLNETQGIVGSYDKVLITNDAGSTWTPVELPGFETFYDIEWKTDSIIFATCERGVIIRSMDGGRTWEKITTGPSFDGSIKAATWYDENTIMAFTNYPNEIVKSVNKGFLWEKLSAPAEGFLRYNCASAIPGEALFVSTMEGLVFKTINGGESWQTIETGTTNPISTIHFINAETGIFTTNDGNIYLTSNGGDTWATVSSGTPNITGLAFYDNQLGMAVGAEGTILRTTDGGLNWINISNDNTKTYSDVIFVDQNTVLAVGESGSMFRSQDSGLSWVQITSGVNYNLISVEFMTPEVGVVTTSLFGHLLQTEDGGVNWSIERYMAPSNSKVLKIPDGSIMAYGDYYYISILPKENTWVGPSTPLALEASAVGETSFIAQWQPVEDANAYYLLVSNDDFLTYLPGYIPKYCEQTSTLVDGIEPNKTYQYKVIATNAAGNSDESNPISVQTLQTHIGSENEQSFSIYPNPVENSFTITIRDSDLTRVVCQVYDFFGRLVKTTPVTGTHTQIDVSDLIPAIYLVRILTENQDVKTYKIIKK
jgi:photosystem II stability/assembly factor-like uncharacterized protein